jgi:hypothetical protein
LLRNSDLLHPLPALKSLLAVQKAWTVDIGFAPKNRNRQLAPLLANPRLLLGDKDC